MWFDRETVAQEEEQSPTNRKVGGFPGPHVKVSLGKILNPTLPTDVIVMNVCEWVIVACSVRSTLSVSARLEKVKSFLWNYHIETN